MIEAYCGRRSFGPGDEITLHLSTDAGSFSFEVIREGIEPQSVYQSGTIEGRHYAVPDDAPTAGCRWPVGSSFQASPDWVSGFYRIHLTTCENEQAEAFFVLRAAGARSRILWVIETNTWNAYNLFGGSSLYAQEDAIDTWGNGNHFASFERPLSHGFITLPPGDKRFTTVGPADRTVPYIGWALENGISFWTGGASWSNTGARFARWLEKEGIDVDYAVSSDLEEFPGLLEQYRLMLSVGHDEYWSWGMRDAVEAFIDRGGNAAFFSGNAVFWQVRFEDDFGRMVAFKDDVNDDPVMGTANERRNTGIWSHRVTKRPENSLTGLSFTRGGYARIAGATPASAGGYTIYRKDHWALEGTGLSYGDQLGAASSLAGYEIDGCEFDMRRGLPQPTGRDGTPANFEIIGIAPATLWSKETGPPGNYPDDFLTDLEIVCEQMTGDHSPATCEQFVHGHGCFGTYISKQGGTVFSAGTTDWAFSLEDSQVARITHNVVTRLSA